MKIYTRRGDAGETDLFGGERVAKDTLRVETYGDVDELNAVLGLCAASSFQEDVRKLVGEIQSTLFGLGSYLATPDPAHRKKAGIPEPEAADVDALLPEALGVDLPAARLPRWIQAAPATDAEVRILDAAGRPQLVFDQGWRIDYAGYADDTAAAAPQRLEISRGDARVRLIIDSWTALP